MLGRGLTLQLFSVFMSRVLPEYAYFLSFICFQWITYVQIVNQKKKKKYSEFEAHETLKRVASANAIVKHYKSYSCDCACSKKDVAIQTAVFFQLLSKRKNMHFTSRVFFNTTALMTSVSMLYVGTMAITLYLS